MPVNVNPLIVGLTGPIGAGKTTVADLLRKQGFPVINADRHGRDVLSEPGAVRGRLAEAFGPGIFAPDGSVDRRALAREAFADENGAECLNKLVHPLLWEKIRADILAAAPAPVVIIDAALILEWKDDLAVDLVVVVDAPEDVRLERCRPKYDAADFFARQGCQLSPPEKRAGGHIIVENVGPLAELELKTEALAQILYEIAASGQIPAEPVIL
jgi:dephospho-CoA kinase